MKTIELEVCITAAEDARRAESGGANGVEICSALEIGGITPSYGLMKATRAQTGVDVVALIRPRGGDFIFSTSEVNVQIEDIRAAKDLGMDGVAIGALTPAGEPDLESLARLAEAARPMKVVFHRAFDQIPDQASALESLVELGFDRIMSSGGRDSAWEGRDTLKALNEQSAGRIEMMPGGGIREHLILGLHETTQAQRFHFTAHKDVVNTSAQVHLGVVPEAESRQEVDPDLIRKYRAHFA